ncbi:MAG: glycosyltransferase family 4 protein [Bacilli bacterium]|jgi:glycosyltransferase involved in cell wall biosynthesis
MKILFVFAHPAPYKIDLFNGLAPHVELTVVFERHASGFRHPYFYDRTHYAFKTIFLRGISFGAENHYSRELIRHLKKNDYDLIVMNGYSSLTEIVTINYLQRTHRPYVLYVNGGVVRKDPPWRKRLKTRLISRAAHYFAPAPQVDDYLIHYGANPALIVRYPYATLFHKDLSRELIGKDQRITFWKRLGIPRDNVFLSAGQFVSRKNNTLLLSLWAKRSPDDHLVLVGSGPEEAKYRRFIEDNDLHNVHLIGYQRHEDLLNFMAHAEAFIILSKEDIYGHVVNESLSQGTPVIGSSRVIAARHLIKDGYNGFVVDPENENGINQAIDQIQGQDTRRGCLDTAAQFTIETMVAQHLAAFQNLVK